MVRYYQLQDCAARLPDPLCIGMHNHSIGCRSHTRCGQSSSSLDFYYTYSARTYFVNVLEVAEAGDIDARLCCGLENARAFRDSNLPSVNGESNITHSYHTPFSWSYGSRTSHRQQWIPPATAMSSVNPDLISLKFREGSGRDNFGTCRPSMANICCTDINFHSPSVIAMKWHRTGKP